MKSKYIYRYYPSFQPVTSVEFDGKHFYVRHDKQKPDMKIRATAHGIRAFDGKKWAYFEQLESDMEYKRTLGQHPKN